MSTHVFNFHSLIASGIEPLLPSVGCLWSLTVHFLLGFLTHLSIRQFIFLTTLIYKLLFLFVTMCFLLRL